MIIAIDGPAGSGKSTTARLVAQALGFYHLDSGLMYRGAAIIALSGIPPAAGDTLAAAVRATLRAHFEHGTLRLRWGGQDIQTQLRTPAVSAMASRIATSRPVREVLMAMQLALAEKYGAAPGMVVEGRDIGTVVFPEAKVKVFMTASLEVRARRRYEELIAGGNVISQHEVLQSMRRRDKQDAGRKASPLRRPLDATVMDSAQYSVDAQVRRIVALAREHMPP